MKMTAWILASSERTGVPEYCLRTALYRGVIPMPRRHVINRRVMEVIDPPLQSAPISWRPQTAKKSSLPKSPATSSTGSTPRQAAPAACSGRIS